jgi:hypothetical protein
MADKDAPNDISVELLESEVSIDLSEEDQAIELSANIGMLRRKEKKTAINFAPVG